MRAGPLMALLLAAATAAAGCGYNEIQRRDEAVDQAAGQIRVQLQRRADLIPNLTETVRGVARQESTVFIGVAEARARLAGVTQLGTVPEMAAANQQLTQALGRLLVVVERYPELRSDQSFRTLMDQLEGTENRIAVARTDYNQAVERFNAYIRQFPYNLTAKLFGKSEPRVYFELTEPGVEKAPSVKFSRR